mgnify:CR=1 FL=1
MFIGKRAWKCPRCGYVGVPDSTRLGERLGTAIGGAIGGFVGYCAFGSFTQFPVPRAEITEACLRPSVRSFDGKPDRPCP